MSPKCIYIVRALGPEYYVDVPVQKAQDARLVLLNEDFFKDLFKQYGVEWPSDPKVIMATLTVYLKEGFRWSSSAVRPSVS